MFYCTVVQNIILYPMILSRDLEVSCGRSYDQYSDLRAFLLPNRQEEVLLQDGNIKMIILLTFFAIWKIPYSSRFLEFSPLSNEVHQRSRGSDHIGHYFGFPRRRLKDWSITPPNRRSFVWISYIWCIYHLRFHRVHKIHAKLI